VGAITLARTTTDGFRQFSRADTRQGNAAADWALGDATTLAFRAAVSETPTALNPGALTEAEYRVNRDSASALNVARDASRAISQNQFSLRARHHGADGSDVAASLYVIRRFVDNPLATSPPGAVVTRVGTYSTLNRWVTGLRLDGSRPWCACARAPRVSAGLDVQRSLDLRRNRRATGGHPSVPTDTLLVNQSESVASLGPFAAVQWSPVGPVTVDAGARWDRLTFAVRDHFLGDGADNSGSRDMTATSGHLGASWRQSAAFTPYANYSTAFETPTTTELNARADGQGGFNPDLGPQRVRTVEGGARGAMGGRVNYSLSVFRAEAEDAIIQYLEANGRAYFRNAGRTRNDGVEIGLAARVADWLDLHAAWTAADYRFLSYRVPNRNVVDTLDGKKQAGVPDRFVRLGAAARWGAWTLDADHTMASALWADDRNTLRVEDWGQGTLNVHATWSGAVGDFSLAPFVAVNNLLNQSYVGAVTLNGAGGRVRESAPLRNFYAGMELGWRARR
jgi:iron complex outermembrane receptor protein